MELSAVSKRFKEALPDSLRSMAVVSMKHKDYLVSVINNLRTLYGDFADPNRNREKYLQSEEYKNACREIKKLSKIPEISFEEIRAMVDEEDAYNEQADRLLKLKDQLTSAEGEEKNRLIMEMGRILGIVPDSENGLFSRLVDFHGMTAAEKAGFSQSVASRMNVLGVAVSLLSDFFVDGMIEEFSPAGSIMTQPYRKCFYRGEYAYFGSSKTGMFRNVEEEEIPFARIVGWMRIDECCGSFDSFDAVNHWSCSDVNYIALAQHYGLKTMMVDITSDLRTALFFACCKTDDNGKWVPLSKEDFEHRSSRKEKLGLNALGDSRFGILYRASRELTDLHLVVSEVEEETILPVGYQPFMRCAAQSAYMLLAADASYDMYRDVRFEKVKFRLTEEICEWIYDEMHQGKKIYPHDDIPDIYPEMTAQNKSVTFSEPIYRETCERIRQLPMTDEEKTIFFRYLSERGVHPSADKRVFSEERIREINEKYTPAYAEQLIGKPTLMRPMIHVSAKRLDAGEASAEETPAVVPTLG